MIPVISVGCWTCHNNGNPRANYNNIHEINHLHKAKKKPQSITQIIQ